jgi:hypothetical protein
MSKIVLGAVVEGISTRSDGSFKIVVGTQEIDRSQVADLFALTNRFCKVLITDRNISPIEEQLVENERIHGGKKAKTPAQRLRSVMFRIHEQQGLSQEFDQFYGNEMERLIDQYKQSLND